MSNVLTYVQLEPQKTRWEKNGAEEIFKEIIGIFQNRRISTHVWKKLSDTQAA